MHRLTAPGDADFLFGADDQLAVGQQRLQALADVPRSDETILSFASAGEAPEHRAVVDVEHDARLALTRDSHGCSDGSGGSVRRQMGAGDRQRATRGDIPLIEIVVLDVEVRAVLAEKNMGIAAIPRDAENHECSQPFRIGMHVAHVDASAL